MRAFLVSMIPWVLGATGLGLTLQAYGVDDPSWLILPAAVFLGAAWGTRRLSP